MTKFIDVPVRVLMLLLLLVVMMLMVMLAFLLQRVFHVRRPDRPHRAAAVMTQATVVRRMPSGRRLMHVRL